MRLEDVINDAELTKWQIIDLQNRTNAFIDKMTEAYGAQESDVMTVIYSVLVRRTWDGLTKEDVDEEA